MLSLPCVEVDNVWETLLPSLDNSTFLLCDSKKKPLLEFIWNVSDIAGEGQEKGFLILFRVYIKFRIKLKVI